MSDAGGEAETEQVSSRRGGGKKEKGGQKGELDSLRSINRTLREIESKVVHVENEVRRRTLARRAGELIELSWESATR